MSDFKRLNHFSEYKTYVSVLKSLGFEIENIEASADSNEEKLNKLAKIREQISQIKERIDEIKRETKSYESLKVN